MKLVILSLIAAIQAASAAIPSDAYDMDSRNGPVYKYVYDYLRPPTATKKCALINIAMDESGSMSNEQNFLRQRALPDIIKALYSNKYSYDDVFVCSNGFGYSPNPNPHDYRFHGCTRGYLHNNGDGTLKNNTVTAWTHSGGWEEGYFAMTKSMENVARYIDGVDLNDDCAQIDKNFILVTDEDRDNDNTFTKSMASMKNDIINNKYILNVVCDATIDNNRDYVGLQIYSAGFESRVFVANGSGGYSTTTKQGHYAGFVANEDPIAVNTNQHYLPLIVDTGGAAWNVNSLRDSSSNSALLVDSFTKAFVETKVEELASGCVGLECGGGSAELGGDPHITTWKNEHYEYHGQCDLVMMNDPDFADGLGISIHIRTKIVRFWSYIQSVAIRIGNDILEIEGSADALDEEAHYWYNYEYQAGEDNDLAGFPIIFKKQIAYKRQYIIDLGPKYPGQSITVQLFKEFLRLKFNGDDRAFGDTVGLLGDYKTGKTVARDGVTDLGDFNLLGEEWQVTPADGMLFHEASRPTFPEACITPEDPRGDRQRRLDESSISMEQAEAACAVLKNPLVIKDCVYDIVATQDMDMVGAF